MRLLLDAGADPAPDEGARDGVDVCGTISGPSEVRSPTTKQRAARLSKRNCVCKVATSMRSTMPATSALHIAASERDEAFVRFLVEHGARLDLKDKRGRTPSRYRQQQRSRGNRALLVHLSAAQARLNIKGRVARGDSAF